jgi:perosamine synthetase
MVADLLGVKHVIAVCNGTVSLMLIYGAGGLRPGDEVITPSLTYCATISQLNWLGVTPVLVDSDNNFQMDLSQLESVMSQRTVGVVVPQLYGDSPDMNKLVEFCNERELTLIEDSAECFACEYEPGKFIGSFGCASSFSFFANKTITTGAGGCIATNDDYLAKRFRLLRSQAHIGGFVHDGPGFNFRMTNIHAAIGKAQLEELDRIVERKKQIARYYRNKLSDSVTKIVPKIHSSSEWMPLFMLPETITYPKFLVETQKRGVDTRPCFTPIHLMKGFQYSQRASLANSERIYTRGFNLPSYPDLTDDQLKYICDVVNEVVEMVG